VTTMTPGIERRSEHREVPQAPEPEPAPTQDRWEALLDGLPDAFIEPDATPESIADLRRRLGMPAVEGTEGPATTAEAAEDTDAYVMRRPGELEADGHGPQRHEGQVTDQQLRDRVLYGHDPAQTGHDKTVDAVTGGEHRRPDVACRFDTPEVMVAADDAVRDSAAFGEKAEVTLARGRQSMWVRMPLDDDGLQPEMRGQVTGYERIGSDEQATVQPVDFTGGQIHAVYRWDDSAERWKIHTIYPDRRGPSDGESSHDAVDF
jgi:hypothetical protein